MLLHDLCPCVTELYCKKLPAYQHSARIAHDLRLLGAVHPHGAPRDVLRKIGLHLTHSDLFILVSVSFPLHTPHKVVAEDPVFELGTA